ncbi:hypothetical protein BpHYR1_034349 [Brachionus plicatilis]|uniref:Peptidase A2 domain-containing protein n=1 Tax=Brachionus plicatilis TaxID=10195 RepID=A0A3M7R9D8_BRAPC|nr:hypothetical protein BpHYR1_034349 [Brachionus plicatilis]
MEEAGLVDSVIILTTDYVINLTTYYVIKKFNNKNVINYKKMLSTKNNNFVIKSKILLITKFLDNIICYQVDNIIGGEDFDNIFCYQLITLSTRPEEAERKDIRKIFDKLKETCFRPTEYYLNLFYSRILNPGESLARSTRFGCDCEVEIVKGETSVKCAGNNENFPRTDSRQEMVRINIDYKSVLPGQFKQVIEINKAVPKPQYENRRFVGNCNYCNKPGHKWALCRRRMFDADKKSESKDTRYERKHQQQTPNYQMQSQNYQHRMHQNQNQSVYNNKQNRAKTSAFTIEAEVEDESEVVANTVQCESFSLELARVTKLTRLETMVSVGNRVFSVPMLQDSGATSSFINISKLPKELPEKVNKVISGQSEFNDLGLERVEVNIKSALNCQAVACARGTVRMRINSWSAEHEFIFTTITERSILGVDFLKRFKAFFDYEKEIVSLSDNQIRHQINCLCEEPVTSENDTTNKNLGTVRSSVIVKPKTEMLVEIQVKTKDKIVMFEPRPEKSNNLNQEVIWARSVSSEGRLRVSVMNITERDIMLEEGAEVGVWEEVEIDEEFEVESLNEDGDIKWDTIQINPELTNQQQKSTADLLSRPPQVCVNKLETDVNVDWEEEQGKYREIAVVRLRKMMRKFHSSSQIITQVGLPVIP